MQKSLILLTLGYLLSGSLSAGDIAVTTTVEISSTRIQSISGQWKFKAGDELFWGAAEYDDSKWNDTTVPQRWLEQGYPETEQFAWYRLSLQLAPSTKDKWGKLGVEIGKVLSAYEIYAGGKLLGGIGGLPPNSDVNYDQTRIYSIPLSAINSEGKLVLALRVWGGTDFSVIRWGGGPHDGQFSIGEQVDLLERAFLDLLPALALSILFLGFGLYHLYLYMRNTQLHGYLWYGLTALDISLYSLMSSQLRYYLSWDFISYEKIEFSAIYALPPLLMQMI